MSTKDVLFLKIIIKSLKIVGDKVGTIQAQSVKTGSRIVLQHLTPEKKKTFVKDINETYYCSTLRLKSKKD